METAIREAENDEKDDWFQQASSFLRITARHVQTM
jgi:hypothetical protein